MTRSRRQLYGLLPEYYRQRDLELGFPLRTLMDVLELELAQLEGSIEGLYDDWFIETCQRRMIPYIGDLVGVGPGPLERPPTRVRVAAAIGTRRRKGTRVALEAALRDTTGWAAHVVEHLPPIVIETSEEIDIVRIDGAVVLEDIDVVRTTIRTPFGSRIDEAQHTKAGDGGGIAVYLWRRSSTPLEWTVARHAGSGCFTFDPCGLDRQLFNLPVRSHGEFVPSTIRQLPIRISRAALARDLEALRAGRAAAHSFLAEEPVLRIAIPPRDTAREWPTVPPERMWSCDLSHWKPPDTATAWDVAIDPELGRVLFRHPPAEVRTCWCTAWPPLLDAAEREQDKDPEIVGTYNVSKPWHAGPPRAGVFDDIGAALVAARRRGGGAVIRVLDSATYAAPHEPVHLPDGAQLRIEGAPGELPCLTGTWRFHANRNSGPLLLDRLRFEDRVETHGPALLVVSRCVLRPASAKAGHGFHDAHAEHPALRASDSTAPVEFRLSDTVCGPVEMPGDGGQFSADRCILDGHGRRALSTGIARLRQCTVFGEVDAEELRETADVIFAEPINIASSHGELRFCAIARDSHTPPRVHCYTPAHDDVQPSHWFASRRFGDPGYAQLVPESPLAVQTGAEDGAEMGAYHDLGEGARWMLIEAVLNEYLPFGVRADVFFVT